jgi:tetratricopeptide (TPR) repeat protein/transcriptional regulator with XRE-family HTH domain
MAKSASIPNTLLLRERLRRGWTQQELADNLGTTPLSISRWERGEILPSPYFRMKLGSLYGKSERELGFAAGHVPTPLLPQEGQGVYDPAIPLPITEPTHLVGRDGLLDQIKSRLREGGPPNLVALDGLPGVGKTTLAVALAHDPAVRAAFPDGILWAGLGPDPNLGGTLSRWGILLGLAQVEMSALSGLDAWQLALKGAIGQRRLLLVLDDAWRPEDALALRIGGPNAAYLLTSRFPEVATVFARTGVLRVEELPEEEGLALLVTLAPAFVSFDRQAAVELVRAAGGLPLALSLMGNYLRVQAQSGQARRIAAAARRLREDAERFALTQPQAAFETRPSLPAGASLSLQSVIGASVEVLPPPTQTVLQALSVFPPKPNTFSEEAAIAVSGATVEALDRLTDTGLLDVRGPERYALHQTIADYARLHREEEFARQAERRLVAYYLQFLEERAADHEAVGRDSANIFAALAAAAALDLRAELVQLATAFFPYLDTRGLYEAALAQLTRAESAARGLEDPSLLVRVLLQLGDIAQKRGEYERARAYCEEGLALARGLGHSELITPLLSTLGWVTSSQGDYAQAEALLQEGVDLARSSGDPERLCTLLLSLGALAISLAEYPRAEAYFQEGIVLARELNQLARTSVMLTGLGVIADLRGDFAGAEAYLLEGLDIARRLEYRERIAIQLLNLGVVENERGNFARADDYDQEALALARHMGHGELSTVLLSNMGQMAAERGDYAQADEYSLEGLALARKMGFRDRFCSLLTNLATSATMRGEYARAESYLEEGLALARQLEQRDTLASLLHAQGGLSLERGEYAQAEDLLQESLTLSRSIDKRVGVWMTLVKLGEAQVALGRLHAAEEAAREVLSQVPAGESRKLRSLATFVLARVRAAHGDLAQGRALGEECLAAFEAMGHAEAARARAFLQELPPAGGGGR